MRLEYRELEERPKLPAAVGQAAGGTPAAAAAAALTGSMPG